MPEPNMKKDPAFLISAARLRLMGTSAGLLARVGMILPHLPNPDIPTLRTNSVVIEYNPAFIESLPPADIETALLHEYGHVALHHPERCPASYDQKTANVAMDHAVNLWITSLRRTIPSNWYCDPAWTGRSWEFIYSALIAQAQAQAQEQDDAGDDAGNGPPAPGQAGDVQGDVFRPTGKSGEALTDAELAELSHELSDRITRIAQAETMAGAGSDSARRYLSDISATRDPDLYQALAALLERSADDHSYRRINRRLLGAGIYPGIDGEECPPLVIAIDTSGSIDDRILSAFNAKIRLAVETFRPRAITIIYCDSRINGDPQTYTPDDMPPLTPHGGGGTDFHPPFTWVADNMTEPPAALVYLTDLDGEAPADAPDYPVIWAATPCRYQRQPAFGQVVPLII
jgi:predicted metal-dependent peptidase